MMSARERSWMVGGAAGIAALLGYALVVAPLTNGVQRLERAVRAERENYMQASALGKEILALNTGHRTAELEARAREVARAQGLTRAVTRSAPAVGGGFEMRLEGLSWSQAVGLLKALDASDPPLGIGWLEFQAQGEGGLAMTLRLLP